MSITPLLSHVRAFGTSPYPGLCPDLMPCGVQGVLLFVLLTGRKPFDLRDVNSLQVRIAAG